VRDALRVRVTGTIPGTTNILFNAFRSEYTSQFTDGTSPDVFGAAGPLDFNLATGEAPSDIQIWCMPRGSDGTAQSAIGSGLYLDAGSNALQGAIGTICD
jgi:hypothetical protein